MILETVRSALKKLKEQKKSENLFRIIERLTAINEELATENSLTKRSCICKKKTYEILKFIIEACKCGFLPDIDPETELSRKYFENYIEESIIILESIQEFLKAIGDLELIPKHELNEAVVHLLIFCGIHADDYDWTNASSKKLSSELLNSIFQVFGAKDLPSVETGATKFNSEFYLQFAKPFFISILPRLLEKKWKDNPGFKHVFKWYLFHIQHPHLGELLPEVLPPSLLFVDDYIVDNKILGIECLNHIIDNVDPSELMWFGRAEVIYSALRHLLYTHEVELIPVLHPCLLKSLRIVEGEPSKILKYNRFDKVFEIILLDMEFEQRLAFRRAYVTYLPHFVEKMGITIVRHLQRLLEMISSYLEEYDGPEGEVHHQILILLKSLILNAWPRIPQHMESILKILLKFLYVLETAETTAPPTVKEELIFLTKECLLLIKQTSPEKFKDLCSPLINEALNLPAVRTLKFVLETEECACSLRKDCVY